MNPVFVVSYLIRESPGARGRTSLNSVGSFAVLFQLFICLGGEVSGLGAPPFLPTSRFAEGKYMCNSYC